ncbi:MAG: zinc metallopeptidase [Oscillospiraceae bacterium]|nr:zinc metallopeptidase [Oscillospiraceae bacterium]
MYYPYYGYGSGYGFDYFWLLVIPAFILSLIAQLVVNSTYRRYSKVPTQRGVTGDRVARMILDANGLQSVNIEHISGNLTDHYDPQANVIRLSDSTYGNDSVAAAGVAAHEAGHAVQYAEGYGPIKLRAAIIPVTQIGAGLSWPAILLGVLMSIDFLITLGILLFSLSVVFQLVTLPVEFNASHRAVTVLEGYGVLDTQELDGAKKVLRAAAWTYIAALAVSLANLLRLILMFGGRRRN